MLETFKERFCDEADELPEKPLCGGCTAFSASMRFVGYGCCLCGYEVVMADDEACEWWLEQLEDRGRD